MQMRAEALPENEIVELATPRGEPQITFVMPIYRQEAYIKGAVASVLRQEGVTVEILISDDGSGDDTLALALDAVEAHTARGGCNHRILVRRGSERLRRDHLPLLVEQASCDLVCQAHGDDLSHPARASILVEIFTARPRTTLIAVDFVPIDARGQPRKRPEPVSRPLPLARYSIESIVACPPELIGALQAWRRSAVAGFGPLTSRVSPVSHDRILPFRAALAGEVCAIKSHLVLRRLHEQMWGNEMQDRSSEAANRFNWTLARQAAYRAMQTDLDRALELELVNDEQASAIRSELESAVSFYAGRMLETYTDLYNRNMRLTWLSEAELEAIPRGETRD
jgi:hypothetical protein